MIGATLRITIKPFINRAPYYLSTETFTVATFTDASLRYQVDRISGGLLLFSCEAGFYLQGTECLACLPPCKTCLSSTLCLSCYTDEFSTGTVRDVLIEGTCLKRLA